ncbi:MAG TPA: hypothetical protein DEA97_09915 [Bacteroidales bacterium]|nr:hypothetical protein [Bacteroidales bacterium]
MRTVICILLFIWLLPFTGVSTGRDFIENKGQVATGEGLIKNDVLFKSSHNNTSLFFMKDRVVFLFNKYETIPSEESRKERALGNFKKAEVLETKPMIFRMDLEFVNSNHDVEIHGEGLMEYHSNYYLAHCPDGILNVKHYSSITYKNLYPGIDLRYYYNESGFKYDFIVHPGGDINDIRFRYNGASEVSLGTLGEMNITFADNRLMTEASPIAYFSETNNSADVQFKYDPISGEAGFICDQEITQELVIDPAITWATYFYNSSSTETTTNNYTNSEYDANGNLFMAAQTYDNAFPTVNAGGSTWYDASSTTMIKVVVLKFTAARALVWSTYYGGDQYDCLAGCTDYGKALALDNNGNVYVSGYTTGGTTVFPTYNPGGGAFYQDQSKCYGQTSFFVKFNNSGVRLWASMYQHENANTNWAGIVVNSITSDGTYLYFSGQTYRSNTNDIPLRNPGGGAYYQGAFAGDMDAFVGRFNSSCALNWSTYVNSGNTSNKAYAAGLDVTCDASGNFYMTGRETSNTGPVVHHLITNPGGGAFMQSTPNGSQNIQISKFNSSLQSVWSTYYGGNDMDIPSTIEVNSNGNIFIVGRCTESTNFPTYDPGGGAWCQTTKPTAANMQDGFVLKFSSTCARLWASYLGGTGASTNHFSGLALDNLGNVYVSGYTNSTTMSTLTQSGSYNQASIGGNYDMFYYQFDQNCVRQWATYYGSTSQETAYNGRFGYHDAACGLQMITWMGTQSTSLSAVNPGGGAWYQSTGGSTYNDFFVEFSNSGSPLAVSVSASASQTTICSGTSVTFTATPTNGGSSPAYQWYLNGNPVGTGSTYASSSLGNGDQVYCVLTSSEGCTTGNPATSSTITMTVNSSSTAPTSITASSTNICPGDNVTLTVSGGSLGTGASWHWYTASCGGTSAGTGSSISVNPSATTTYYVRAEGNCNTTTCSSVTITVKTTSTAPASISATSTTVCPGDNVTLSITGGSLGTGASWHWYTGSCGGTAAGTGSSIIVTPSATTTYYVRAEGDCNTTTCASVTITYQTNSTAPSSITASSTSVCSGDLVTLTVSGGSLGTGASWNWYTGSCGGTLAGTGTSINVNPTSTTTYYIRAEGSCNTTTCASVTVTVKTLSVAPASVSATSTSICSGASVDLSVSGGSLGTGASWYWYTGSCGGTSVGTGASINVAPTATTTYYVRAQGDCNTTTCASVTVNVSTPSSAPAGIIASLTTICEGENVDLSVSGGTLGTGASWHWYTGSCGGTSAGTGSSINVSPAVTTTYYIRAEGDCNNTTCASVTITVNTLSAEPVSITALQNPICDGTTATLNVTGGSLGTGADWYWYVGSCGTGSVIGTGNSLTGTPSTTQTFYVRAEGDCNTTACVSLELVVNDPPNSGFEGAATLCPNDDPINLFDYLNGSPDAGGSWFNESGDPVNDIFDPSTDSPGVYTYTVFGISPCPNASTDIAVYINPLPVVDSLNVTALTVCEPPYDGTITVYVNGSANDHLYAINGGVQQTDSIFTGLNAGTYIISIESPDGCIIETTATVSSSSGLMIDSVNISAPLCFGGNDGMVTIYSDAGFLYSIDGGATYQTLNIFDNLSADTLDVVVQDESGCEFSGQVVITEPDQVNATTSVINSNCGPNGSATVIATGGTGTLSYIWNTGETTSSATGLVPGSYTVTVTDENLCSIILTAVVGEDGEILDLSNTLQNPLCNGDTNGQISVTALSGTAPYTYNWSNGETTDNISGLEGGEYFLTVTDANGCSAIDTFNIQEPEILATTYDVTNVSCYEGHDGSILLNITGGTPIYNIEWSPFGFAQDSNLYYQLIHGGYAVTITDANGCQLVIPKIDVLQPNELVIGFTSINPQCNGEETGSITTQIIGGVPPYTYTWSNDATTSGQSSLSAGSYTLTVTDINGCIIDSLVVITEPDSLLLTSETGISNIDITVTGGTTPYEYLWSGSQTTEDLSGLTGGIYTVTVTDLNGCVVSGSYEFIINLDIPDAFSPNGDGANDGWEIVGIDQYPGCRVEIYNRWGQMIFESNGYNEMWDGTYNGQEMPHGSYVFILDLGEGSEPINGIVTIIR